MLPKPIAEPIDANMKEALLSQISRMANYINIYLCVNPAPILLSVLGQHIPFLDLNDVARNSDAIYRTKVRGQSKNDLSPPVRDSFSPSSEGSDQSSGNETRPSNVITPWPPNAAFMILLL